MFKFVNNKGDLPAHSSSYAKIARGPRLGSTNVQSFSERYRMERSRQAIKHYGASRIGSTAHFRPSASDHRQATGADKPKISQPQPVRNFVEPTTRPYNPYN